MSDLIVIDEQETASPECVVKDDAKYQKWLDRGRNLAAKDDDYRRGITDRQFRIGDWLTEGTEKYDRDIYVDALAIFTNYEKPTLQRFASVARSVKRLSRNKDLSWAHHAAVAPFYAKPELQKKLLDHALENKLAVTKFREHIAREYPPVSRPETPAEAEQQERNEKAQQEWEDHHNAVIEAMRKIVATGRQALADKIPNGALEEMATLNEATELINTWIRVRPFTYEIALNRTEVPADGTESSH